MLSLFLRQSNRHATTAPVTFAGRLEPRPWTDRDANLRVAIEVHGVELEYGPKPRAAGAGDRAEEVPA